MRPIRITTRRTMIVVALAALLLLGLRTWAIRPCPGDIFYDGGVNSVVWSDESETIEVGPHQLEVWIYAFLSFVRWPDGSISVYFAPPVSLDRLIR